MGREYLIVEKRRYYTNLRYGICFLFKKGIYVMDPIGGIVQPPVLTTDEAGYHMRASVDAILPKKWRIVLRYIGRKNILIQMSIALQWGRYLMMLLGLFRMIRAKDNFQINIRFLGYPQ